MQTNINNLHENITKLKHDTEIAKSKMFSCENISQNKEMFKPKTGHGADEADDFRAVLNFLTLVVTMSNFMMVKIIKSLKVILKMLKLEKRQSSR